MRSGTVLGVVGSPHRSGNTAKLVEKVLEGAQERGYETEILYLCDFKINPLSAGNHLDGVSYPKDDMEKIYPSLEEMDVLVLGTPIYHDHVSDRTKVFIDRLHYYEDPSFKELFPKNVRAVVIITYEWDNPKAYDDVVEWLKGRLERYWKMKVVATLKAENTDRKPVTEREDLLRKAKLIGLNL